MQEVNINHIKNIQTLGRTRADMLEYQNRTNDTAIYRDAGEGNFLELMYIGLGLGEAGEIQNKIKKIYRDGWDSEIIAGVRDETGDLMWYVMRLCRVMGWNLVDIIDENLEKLEGRKNRGVLSGSGDDR